MTRIFLCRHGETEFSRDDRYYYLENSPLTNEGRQQTTNLAARLRHERVTGVFTSPFERAISTAEIIAEQHDLPLDILPNLAEWDPGDWSGLTRIEVRSRFPQEYELWTSDPAAHGPPGGESCYAVAARATPAFLALAELHVNETIVVVGHNTLNRVILAHALGIPISDCRERVVQLPGALNQLHYDSTIGWQIDLLNHLPSTSENLSKRSQRNLSVTEKVWSPEQFLKQIELVEDRLEPIWPEGRNPCVARDGQHWTLAPFQRPVSIGKVESYFLHNLAALLAPDVMLEIGTGFGYSSIWMAAGAIAANILKPVLFTIDNQSEGGLGNEGLRFAREACRQVGVSRVIKFVHGSSPDVLATILRDRAVTLAFIDGNHHGQQPTIDFRGVSAFTHQKSIIAWHDVDERYSVPEAFAGAVAEGWRGRIFDTSCRLGITYRVTEQESLIEKAFESACNLMLLSNLW
jgi:broad specificity phosphatase PhoE/predicted O-methyltransferase YrrM